MFPTASRGSSASRTLSAGKEEDDGAIDPDLGPTMSSASQPAPSSRQSAHAGRASSEGQNNMLSRTLDMLDRTQMNLAAAVDRVDEANLRAQRASDRAASQELAGVKLQQTVEHLKRELEGADATNGRAKKRARPADDEGQASTSGQAASPPAPAQGQRSEATRDGKVGELEAEVAALKRAADAARAERQEVVREKDLKIVELQLALDRLKNESSEAANGSEDKLRAGLVKIARLERTVEELETADKRARLASKRADDKDDEVADPKAKLAAAEAVQVQCSNAAHIAVAADVERHKEVIKRLQTEHRAVGDVRKTLMEWMPSLESIRKVVNTCAAARPSKDAASLHRWVLSLAETTENLAGELMWAQTENDSADEAEQQGANN